MPIDPKTDPEGFESLMLRIHCRRVAQICSAYGRDIPAGVVAFMGGTMGPVEADNDTYAAWCKSHGVEALSTTYPDWDGKADPGPLVLAVVE